MCDSESSWIVPAWYSQSPSQAMIRGRVLHVNHIAAFIHFELGAALKEVSEEEFRKAAENFDLPVEAIKEAIAYYIEHVKEFTRASLVEILLDRAPS